MNKLIEIKASDERGWAALRLVAVICNQQKTKLIELSQALTENFTEQEILQIWKQVKMLLTQTEIEWLEGTLRQSIEELKDER